MRSAISLISHNKIGNYSIIRRFCKGVATIKPPRNTITCGIQLR